MHHPFTGPAIAATMVLVRRIGRERPYPLVLLLYVATLGIYGIYWHYKTHHEVYRQFELDLDGRQEGVVWLVLDRVFFPLRWIYQYGFVGNVAHVRTRMGAKKSLSPATFLGLTIPGGTLVYAAFILAVVASSIDADASPRLATGLAIAAGAAFVLGAGLQIPAFAMLQTNMNGLWRAFDQRMLELMPPAPSPPADAWRSVPEDVAPAPEWPGTPPT